MSHKIESTVAARRESGLPIITNLDLLKSTCEARKLPEPVYTDSYKVGIDRAGVENQGPVSGWKVELPGWTKACVFDIEKGNVYFDNWPTYDENHVEVKAGRRRLGEGGEWGDFQHMLDFEAEYLQQAISLGRSIWEEEMLAAGGMVQVESDTDEELVLLCSQ